MRGNPRNPILRACSRARTRWAARPSRGSAAPTSGRTRWRYPSRKIPGRDDERDADLLGKRRAREHLEPFAQGPSIADGERHRNEHEEEHQKVRQQAQPDGRRCRGIGRHGVERAVDAGCEEECEQQHEKDVPCDAESGRNAREKAAQARTQRLKQRSAPSVGHLSGERLEERTLELVRARVPIRGIEGGGALDERPQLLGDPRRPPVLCARIGVGIPLGEQVVQQESERMHVGSDVEDRRNSRAHRMRSDKRSGDHRARCFRTRLRATDDTGEIRNDVYGIHDAENRGN